MQGKRSDVVPMTKEQFEDRRRRAVANYMEAARRDRSALGSTRRQKENAERRIRLCARLLSIWAQDGFWTPDNTRAYETIYQYYDDGAPVSAI